MDLEGGLRCALLVPLHDVLRHLHDPRQLLLAHAVHGLVRLGLGLQVQPLLPSLLLPLLGPPVRLLRAPGPGEHRGPALRLPLLEILHRLLRLLQPGGLRLRILADVPPQDVLEGGVPPLPVEVVRARLAAVAQDRDVDPGARVPASAQDLHALALLEGVVPVPLPPLPLSHGPPPLLLPLRLLPLAQLLAPAGGVRLAPPDELVGHVGDVELVRNVEDVHAVGVRLVGHDPRDVRWEPEAGTGSPLHVRLDGLPDREPDPEEGPRVDVVHVPVAQRSVLEVDVVGAGHLPPPGDRARDPGVGVVPRADLRDLARVELVLRVSAEGARVEAEVETVHVGPVPARLRVLLRDDCRCPGVVCALGEDLHVLLRLEGVRPLLLGQGLLGGPPFR
mmetsp:Transcript_43974/g.127167  ORF Transcript_43974/g.127167 Transcript_43974/m.127167 type:complete len:391 (+) Transcript_43974:274-1446(+)